MIRTQGPRTISQPDPQAIRAVVFDLDGTIVDTELVVFEAWRDAFDAHGSSLTLEEWIPNVGTDHGFDPLEVLVERAAHPVTDRSETSSSIAAAIELRLAEMEPRAGVRAWIAEALSLGLSVAVASSSPDDWVETRLEQLELRPHIEVVSCRSERLRAKPDPDVYLDACERLGVPPGAALAVEDSSNGLAAAIAAGMRCVAVPNEITRTLDFSAATLQLGALSESSLADVIGRLS